MTPVVSTRNVVLSSVSPNIMVSTHLKSKGLQHKQPRRGFIPENYNKEKTCILRAHIYIPDTLYCR